MWDKEPIKIYGLNLRLQDVHSSFPHIYSQNIACCSNRFQKIPRQVPDEVTN